MKSRKKNLARLFVNLVQICRLLSNVTKNKAYSDLGSYLKLGGGVVMWRGTICPLWLGRIGLADLPKPG